MRLSHVSWNFGDIALRRFSPFFTPKQPYDLDVKFLLEGRPEHWEFTVALEAVEVLFGLQ